MQLVDLTVKDFVEVLGSDAPAPGGGSAAALAASMGISLTKMVCELTIGKKKYAEFEDEIKLVFDESKALQKHLLEAIDKEMLLKVLDDQDIALRKAAICISEIFINKGDNDIIRKLAKMKKTSFDVRILKSKIEILPFLHKNAENWQTIHFNVCLTTKKRILTSTSGY